MKWFYLLIFVGFVRVCANADFEKNVGLCRDNNHIFIVPGTLTAGGTSRGCLTRFHHEGSGRLTLVLKTEDQQVVTAARNMTSGDGGCIDISVPQLPNTKADLFVSMSYLTAQCTWERVISLRISSGRMVVVHTERARLKPGDLMRVRLFVLKADLTPTHAVIDEIWVEAPRGARAAQWSNTRTRLGLAQINYQLDETAPPGLWTVRASLADGSQGVASFWVGNYELPPFQLSVKHAPRVLKTSERLVWTVCVRYPWTEAVEGLLVIRIRGVTSDSYGIRTVVRLRSPRACHRHAAAAKRIGLGENGPDVVVADFSFQEEGTRVWQNTTVVSQVVDKHISLEFLVESNNFLSMWLPNKLKVKATRFDDKPVTNETIKLCHSPVNPSHTAEVSDSKSCHYVDTDTNGLATTMFVPEDDVEEYKFQAYLRSDSTIHASPISIRVQKRGSAHAALGTLKLDESKTFLPLYLYLRDTHVMRAITVHFAVITRGGIIYRWGASTQCPTYSELLEASTRNSICSANFTSKHITSGTPDKRGFVDIERDSLRIMLPIKVTHQMCPDSHLVAYFYNNGDLVSATKKFEMEECFGKVEATWKSRQTPPGSTTTLHISTPGPALCALTALDSAAKWVEPRDTVKDIVMRGLRRMVEGHRNLTEYDASGRCFLNSDNPIQTDMELPTWLATAGIRVLGGDIKNVGDCINAPAKMVVDDVTVPRSDFSEAWLWKLVSVGIDGRASVEAKAPDSITRYEATAVCVSRHGLAVSPSAILQVFREFFIHADGPRKLRRGDTTIIRYRLFNYLYEPLSVQIQILTDYHLEGPSDYVETACIGARASAARRVDIKARFPGNARVSIRAKSVNDKKCGNTTRKSGVSDEVIIKVSIEPEGVPVKEEKSILLCGQKSIESKTSEVNWKWSPVQNMVSGSESLTVWAAADVTGPLLSDADDLVLLPRGCGEQNMARLATNLLALEQLHPTSAAAATAKEHVARGFARQLQYVHPIGGFSAFGAADTAPSTWLTAFSVRYLRKIHKLLTPNKPVHPAIKQAEQWLLNQQMENGCFRNEGQVFHRELRGGLDEDGEVASVALTAYVITSLIESSILPSRVLQNTLSCLRALPNKPRVYAYSLIAYAFTKIRIYQNEIREANEASLRAKEESLNQDEEVRRLLELLKLAKRSGDQVWFETGSLSTSIEATAYALLALTACPQELRDTCAYDALATLRWLSTHRSSSGGFVATQDTLVALEALTAWQYGHTDNNTDLVLRSRSGESILKVKIKAGEKVPQVINMEVADTLTVDVQGTGCTLVQATRSYNVNSPLATESELSVQISVHTDGPFNCDNGTNCFCAAVVETCVLWSRKFPEMALLEVSLPGGFGVDGSRLYSQLQQNHTLLRRIDMTSSNSKVYLYLGTKDGSDLGDGHYCFELYSIGPRAKTKPAYAKIMDYYKPEINDTQIYTIPEECLPRVSHETPQYSLSDNLYNNAKSRNDRDSGESSEIIISDEFEFSDIPEGVPLDEPIYDMIAEQLVSDNEKKHGINSSLIQSANLPVKATNDISQQTIKFELSIDFDDIVTSQNKRGKHSRVIELNTADNREKEKFFSGTQVNEKQKVTRSTEDLDDCCKDAVSVFYDPNAETALQNLQFDKKTNEEVNSQQNENFDSSDKMFPLINKNNNIETNSAEEKSSDSENDKIKRYERYLKFPAATHNGYKSQYTHKEPVKTKEIRFYSRDFYKSRDISPRQNNHNINVHRISDKLLQIGETRVIDDEVFDPNCRELIKIIKSDENFENNKFIVQSTAVRQANDAINIEIPNDSHLSNFHIIYSDKDLQVPEGIEGPIPAVMSPLKDNIGYRGVLGPNARMNTLRTPPYMPYNYNAQPKQRYQQKSDLSYSNNRYFGVTRMPTNHVYFPYWSHTPSLPRRTNDRGWSPYRLG